RLRLFLPAHVERKSLPAHFLPPRLLLLFSLLPLLALLAGPDLPFHLLLPLPSSRSLPALLSPPPPDLFSPQGGPLSFLLSFRPQGTAGSAAGGSNGSGKWHHTKSTTMST